MLILDTLAQDHRAIEQLIGELASVHSDEPDRRVELFSRLQAILQAHSRAEEEVVYRALRSAQPDEVEVLEAFEEHHVADVLLQELASACPGGRAWTAKLKVLEEVLRHHIKEEELTIFPLVSDRTGEAGQARMDQEFRLLRHEKLERALGPLRRATPAFAGRAAITAQAAAGRYMRRGELFLRRRLGRLPATA